VRGNAGTHDVELGRATLDALTSAADDASEVRSPCVLCLARDSDIRCGRRLRGALALRASVGAVVCRTKCSHLGHRRRLRGALAFGAAARLKAWRTLQMSLQRCARQAAAIGCAALHFSAMYEDAEPGVMNVCALTYDVSNCYDSKRPLICSSQLPLSAGANSEV